MTEAEKALLAGHSIEAKEARKFADMNFAFKGHPLTNSSLDMVWGTGHNYLSDRYGALVDVYPSTKHVWKQMVQPTSHEVFVKRMQDKRFPRITHLVQRWRKPCHECDWKQVLEKPGVPCAAPDCQSLAPEQPTPPEHVRVCDPVTGCHMVKGPALRPRDDLADQVLKGQDSGEADPLGIFDELGDHRQPAAAVLGARHEDHSYRQKWGEPISDFLMGGWDLQQGRTANAHETKEHEKDEPLKYPRYFPHTKGVWSGAKPPEVGGDDDTAEE